jgi:deoxycytidine triphosphate deaminase
MKHIMSPNSKSRLTEVQEGDVQPNAVDLRLGKIFRIKSEEVFEISNDHKKHRGSEEILPDAEDYYTLFPGSYEIVMENIIHVGEGEAGWVITRSTLNRNGCFITSGLYDSSYHGIMAGVLHVTMGTARIKKGTRVGQYISFDAEMMHQYNGSYGFDASGKPKKDEEKYHK